MKTMPKIEKYMTPNPHTIGKEILIKVAYEIMKEHRIRHLPVLEAGKLVGILTDRDIKLAASFGDTWSFRCADIMSPDTYTVRPETPLDAVVEEMAEHKYGSAVVQQENGKVVGIFTSIDALQALDEILKKNFQPHLDY